ncbi:hypothetical protein [Sphaerimonospora mesophila]|uniref:hypothetical protein n=1 Tax=Sphaerimonospora mesophila TaxID=37483 RepID=UPI00128F7118
MDGFAGAIGVSDSNGKASPVVHAYLPNEFTDVRYLAYVLRVMAVSGYVSTLAKGIRERSTAFDAPTLANVLLPSPPLAEQQRIANFLDTETARIDQLQRMRAQQLDLLEERYWITLRRSVTGSQETEPESNFIDWLGPVPLTWGTPPTIGRLARFVMGTTFPHEYQGLEDGDYPFIKVADFSSADEIGYLHSATNWISHDVAKMLGARIVPPGSVLYARVGGALLLNRRIITTRASVIDDNVRAISFHVGDSRYWANLLTLLDMGELMNPGPVPSISESQVASVRIPCPPATVQERIADQIVSSRRTLYCVKTAIQRQMALLAERRQALITAAVTGQFDVASASGRGVGA